MKTLKVVVSVLIGLVALYYLGPIVYAIGAWCFGAIIWLVKFLVGLSVLIFFAILGGIAYVVYLLVRGQKKTAPSESQKR